MKVERTSFQYLPREAMPISFSGAWANLHCWQQCLRMSVAQCPRQSMVFVGLLLLKGYFRVILICVL